MKLGQKITIDHKLKRVKQPNDKYESYNKVWIKEPIKPKEYIVIGIRNLSNGETYLEDDGYNMGRIYESKETIKALLVVESLHRKPFLTSYPKFNNGKAKILLRNCKKRQRQYAYDF